MTNIDIQESIDKDAIGHHCTRQTAPTSIELTMRINKVNLVVRNGKKTEEKSKHLECCTVV
jgi:hypothetical protein